MTNHPNQLKKAIGGGSLASKRPWHNHPTLSYAPKRRRTRIACSILAVSLFGLPICEAGSCTRDPAYKAGAKVPASQSVFYHNLTQNEMTNQPNQLKRQAGGDSLYCTAGGHTTDAAASGCPQTAVTSANYPRISCIPKRDRTALLFSALATLSVLTVAGLLFACRPSPNHPENSRKQRGASIIPNPGRFTRKIHNTHDAERRTNNEQGS
jgi:hypothetical protein